MDVTATFLFLFLPIPRPFASGMRCHHTYNVRAQRDPRAFQSFSRLALLAGCLLYTDSPLSSQSTEGESCTGPSLGALLLGEPLAGEGLGYPTGGWPQEEFDV